MITYHFVCLVVHFSMNSEPVCAWDPTFDIFSPAVAVGIINCLCVCVLLLRWTAVVCLQLGK